MHHPELEKQLQELKEQRKAATDDLRDLAAKAIESTDKVNKTMMLYLQPAGSTDGCECDGMYCSCRPLKKRASKIFDKKKLKQRLEEPTNNGTHP